jgi:hypothetical protein
MGNWVLVSSLQVATSVPRWTDVSCQAIQDNLGGDFQAFHYALGEMNGFALLDQDVMLAIFVIANDMGRAEDVSEFPRVSLNTPNDGTDGQGAHARLLT